MKEKTAVEWLVSELVKNKFIQEEGGFTQPLIIKAKEMEKEHHEQTWLDSTAQFDNSAEMTYRKEFEQYYKETFKSE
jgi:hypothetical protein